MKWPLASLVAIYALAVVGLAVFQRRLLYFPGRRLTHPAEAGMSGVEELRLTAMVERWSTAFRAFGCLRRADTGFSPCPIAAIVARPDRRLKLV